MMNKVFTIANAHLDTIWSWDFETTIREYIYHTIVDNLKLFNKYPHYRFNFEGAYRYELMEEYYPELFEEVKEKISEGRWNVTGSAYENGDVNIPSPEALIRNILYGNQYFKEKFGKTSTDVFLPDCFGFGWALPSIARHMQLKGFSTQKLSWGSAYGVPFDLGKWYGVDGNYIYAALKMHPYDDTLKKVRDWDLVKNKLKENEAYDLPMTAVYYGTGDRGGAPKKQSAAVLEKEISKNTESKTEVLSSTPDELFAAMDAHSDKQKSQLPQWNNELLMSTHAVGSYVSRSVSKRWNRRGEEVADLAERAAVCAYLLGREYPQETLTNCWKRIIRHQFHDDITGTSVQRAYRRVWNDYAMSINQFIGEYEAASKYVADRLDSSWAEGTAVVVHNPCEYPRTDVVEVNGSFTQPSYFAKDKDGNQYPCQKNDNGLLFIAPMEALSYRVFDICEGTSEYNGSLCVSNYSLENENLKAEISADGWVCSIIDKKNHKELLKKPIRLALYDYEGSHDWPAWEIPSGAALANPHYPSFVKSDVMDNGPVKVSIKTEHTYRKSKFISVISLSENGEMLEFQNEILWHEPATMAKQEFILNVKNDKATFDLGLGAIQRGNRNDKLYEVPAQKWADLSDGCNNISVISDSKYSWDKFDEHTLRLTVLHTPKRNYRIDSMQSMMDLGLNRYGFAILSHSADDFVKTNRLAKNFHQKMPSFTVSSHSGMLSDAISFGELCDENVMLRAIKKAENSDEIVLRFNEINNGEHTKVRFKLNAAVASASECFGTENKLTNAQLDDNHLIFDIGKYGIKTFSLSVNRQDGHRLSLQTPLDLNGNIKVYSSNTDAKKSLLPDCRYSVPAELVKKTINVAGVTFCLDANKKALLAKGQKVSLPDRTKRAYLLCGSLNGDKAAVINNSTVTVNAVIENYAGWDLYDYGETAFIKEGRLGFEFTHCHSDAGDVIAKGMLFWLICVNVEDGVLQLPDNDMLILAITADTDDKRCVLSTELFEKVTKRPFDYRMSKEERKQYRQFKRYSKMNDKGRYLSTMNR